ncbi:MAG TPA: ribonuclease R [Geobacteraceae bacterium]
MRLNDKSVLKLLAAVAPAALRLHELAAQAGLGRGEQRRLRELLDGLVTAGNVHKLPGNRYMLPNATTPSGGPLRRGVLSRHRDGYGFVTLDEGGEDIFIPARYLGGAMHGDQVEVRLAPGNREGRREGRVVRVMSRAHSKVVGSLRLIGAGGLVTPSDGRQEVLFVPRESMGPAHDGQLVVARISDYPNERQRAVGQVTEVLGWPGEAAADTLAIIRSHDLPDWFAPEVLAAARAVSQTISSDDLADRTDLQKIPFVTIDGETARDFDDAVAVRREGGGIRLWVSIADVAHYVRPGSSLDREAYTRGTSVYFPDRCLPMLPEELSNGICSLNPGVERLTMTVELLFDDSGDVRQSSFYASVIRSAARLTYTEVARMVVDNDPATRSQYTHLVADLDLMKELALILSARRTRRGSIDFDLPEPEIIQDLQGDTLAIVRSERTLAHRLIEEFMLVANEAVAGWLAARDMPTLYRVHEPPDPAKLNDFQEFAAALGYHFQGGPEEVTPASLQQMLEQVAGKPEERMINRVLLRCMKQARYAAENLGHFGLAAPCYTHFTSPIRRYPDLVVHRILKRALSSVVGRGAPAQLPAELPTIAEHTSKRERVAMEAEREVVELKKVRFMADKVGEEFDGYLDGVTSFGLFVELVDFFVEGLVHIATLPADLYRYLEKEYTLVGERSGRRFRIGDPVRVRVAQVSPERRQIDFVLAETTSDETARAVGELDFRRLPVVGKKPVGWQGKKTSGGGQVGKRPQGKGKGRRSRH